MSTCVGFHRAFIFGNARHCRSHAPFEFHSDFGDHLEVFCVFGCNVEDSPFSASFLHLISSSSQAAVSSRFVSLIVRVIRRARPLPFVQYVGLLWVDRSPVCIRLEAYSVVQRVLGSVVDACSRVSAHQQETVEWENVFILDVQFCSMYFVLVIFEVTTLAPKVFTVFCQGSPWRVFRRVGVEEDQRV